MVLGDVVLATVGDNCIDVYAPPLSVSAVGGQALNVAVIWSRLGWQVEYIGAVGDDAEGRRVRDAIRSQGVSTSRVQVLPMHTSVTKIQVLASGERFLVHEDPGACAGLTLTDDDFALLAGTAHVHAANVPRFRQVIKRLSELGVPVSYDFSTDYQTEDLAGVDTAFYSWPGETSDPQVASLAEAACQGGARVVVVTCGAHGSVLFDGGQMTIAGARSVVPVDTCGAGDTYAAVLLTERMLGSSISAAMATASAAGADACLHVAAWEQQLEPLTTGIA